MLSHRRAPGRVHTDSRSVKKKCATGMLVNRQKPIFGAVHTGNPSCVQMTHSRVLECCYSRPASPLLGRQCAGITASAAIRGDVGYFASSRGAHDCFGAFLLPLHRARGPGTDPGALSPVSEPQSMCRAQPWNCQTPVQNLIILLGFSLYDDVFPGRGAFWRCFSRSLDSPTRKSALFLQWEHLSEW